MQLSVSLPFDRRLAPEDIEGSHAHVTMLAEVGLLTDEERDAILAALDTVARELGDGSFAFAPTDEDIHTAVERRVTELAGPAGAKIHTGRSRNDQVATDLRLWTRPRGPRGRDRAAHAGVGARSRAPRRPAIRSRCPATPTSSTPNRSSWPTTCSPTSGRSGAT